MLKIFVIYYSITLTGRERTFSNIQQEWSSINTVEPKTVRGAPGHGSNGSEWNSIQVLYEGEGVRRYAE